ncbi:hypothetical protein [Planctomyces sp. SH-PL62]|uniref:hypothetical protein n=1 Tax=Planctomyces sp. SH-PL62 TaxID=1636152 RepID=UPI00078DE642|nr:hypothetical protein [Planctomyces sp. SH-PL62]AMV36678.1 hypothetical protein VT85_04560 [Planctomyces sp. SH-PL62]
MNRLRERLAGLAETRRHVHLTRRVAGGWEATGFVLAVGRRLVLLHQTRDFQLDGLLLLPLQDVARLRCTSVDRFAEKVFAGEGMLDQIGTDLDVSLEGIAPALDDLRRGGRFVVIECESRFDPEDDDFLIGPIVGLNVHEVAMRGFAPDGRWDRKRCRVALDSITQIQFDTPYIEAYRKYLAPPPLPRQLD